MTRSAVSEVGAQLRLLFVHPYGDHGGTNALPNYVDQLDPRRFAPTFIVGQESSFAVRMRAQGYPVILDKRMTTVPRTTNPIRITEYLVDQVKLGVTIAHLAAHERIDVIHQSSEAMLAGGLAARISGVPAAVQVIGMSIFTPAQVGFVWSQLLGRLFDEIYCSQEIIQREFSRFLIPDRRLVLLHNSISPETIRERAAGPSPWPGGPIRVGMVALPDPRKGAIHFIRAAGLVRRRCSNLTFHLLGTCASDNEFSRYLAELVREQGLTECFFFEGFVADAPRYIRHLDVLVQPSESEALAIAQLEAMALERPLIVSDVGGNSITVEDGVNGFIVPGGDATILAVRLQTLVGDAVLRSRMGAAGRARVESMFDAAKNVRILEESYRRLVSLKRRKRAIVQTR